MKVPFRKVIIDLKRLGKYYKFDVKFAIYALIIAIISLAISLPIPFIYSKYLNILIIDKDLLLFKKLIFIYVAMTLVKTVLTYIYTYLLIIFNQKFLYRLRLDLLDSLLRTNYSYLKDKHTGYLLSRIFNDVDTLGPILPQSFIELITRLISVIVSSVLMIIIDWRIALFALCLSPLFFINNAVFGKVIVKNSHKVKELFAQLYGKTQEILSNVYIIKSYNKEKNELGIFSKEHKTVIKSIFKLLHINNMSESIATFTLGIAPLLLFFFVFNIYINKEITFGEIIALFYYIMRFYGPVMYIYNFNLKIQNTAPSIERISEVFDLNEEDRKISTKDNNQIDDHHHEIIFKNVTFSYDSSIILDNISFHIKTNSVTAIVGASGSGKTTIANLLLKYFSLDKGEIFIKGKSIDNLTAQFVRNYIGIVPQDNYLFKRSVIDNISFCAHCNNRDKIYQVAKLANIHEVIMKLPQGYDTIIGENSIDLSAGEKQRISIARALYNNPRILILDEPTSSQDSDSQKLIYQTIEQLKNKVTVILITHKLYTLEKADNIIFLSSGKICEEGSFSELHNNNSHFKKYLNLEKL